MIKAKYKKYATEAVNGKICACKYIIQACQRYLDWFERDDIEFRPDAVDRVVNFCGKLRHFTGSKNGEPFVLTDFQFWVVCSIYGFYRKGTNNRVIKNVYLELARKNGKSFFAAALALYNLIADGENNAEVELVANSTKQAKIVFKMCKYLCDGLDRGHKYFKSFRDNIQFEKTKSFLQVLSSDANANDGWNSSMFIVDEYHSAPNSSMYDVMKSSQGNRDNPLSIVITTAGFNLFSPCYKLRQTNIEILSGLKTDDTVFAAIYTLDDDDDWTDERNWIKANPNLGISVKKDYLREQVIQAKNNTSLEVGIRTKNFNCWCSSSDVWINNDLLIKSTKKINIDEFNGMVGFMGVDLSSVSDFTALNLMIPYDGKLYFKNWYFLPQTALLDNANKELYKEWRRKGDLIITNGNVVDYDAVINVMVNVSKTVMIDKVAYDAYNATQWAINATDLGFNLEPYSQALWSFNRPTKEFERLIKMGQVVIDDNEINRWCFGNVALKSDHNDNVKPVKEFTQNKIDGVIAMLESLGTFLNNPNYGLNFFTI